MRDATPEEVRLLRDILMDQENGGSMIDGDFTLAQSFAHQIGRYEHYIVVPWQHEQLVRAYVELLEKSDKSRRSAA
jgi:hypothetical protein